MRTRMTVPILLVVLAFGLLAGPSAMAGELTVVKEFQVAPGEERDMGVAKTPRSKEFLTLPDGRVRLIIQLEEPAMAQYRGGIRGLRATSPVSTGARKLDMKAPKSVAYRGHLRDRQESFARDLTRVAPEARIGHRYQVVFNGMSVAVNPDRLDAISRMPGVEKVYPERLYYQIMDASLPLINAPDFWAALGGQSMAGAGIKVAVVDGGIRPEHPMFDDTGFPSPGMGYPPPGDYCDTVDPTFCNNKLIAARHFNAGFGTLHPDEVDSPLGINGHGTHVAGSAVGNPIVGAAAPDGVPENISGVAPAAWLMVYKALWWTGSTGSGATSDLIAAVDAAVADGADVINNSWGGPGGEDPNTDAFGDVFDAAEAAGVVSVVAAGNAGPGARTIGCPGCQPSVLTVAASSTNRMHALLFDVLPPAPPLPGTIGEPTGLGCLEGTGPAFSGSVGPDVITWAGDVGDFEGCSSFPAGSMSGSIALISRGSCSFATKVANAEAAGAVAAVVFNQNPGTPIIMGGLDSGETISSCMLGNTDGTAVRDWVQANPGAEGLINYPAERVTSEDWEDIMGDFSSRGPNGDPDILKPEITAPGVRILSAWSPDHPTGGSDYTIIQGTSMASPHVAGAAALVLQQHPSWSPTEVKTALTSTSVRDVLVKEDVVTPADPFDRGAGRMDLGNTVNAAVTFDQTSMADGNCFLNCSFDRTLVDQGAFPSSWEAFVENASEGLDVEVTPSTIMLPGTMPPGVEPGLFTVDVDTTFVEQGQWHFADIVWRPVLNGAPTGAGPPSDASMPLAVFATSSTNEALVTKSVDKDVAQPTEVLTYEISLTNLGLTDEISLYDEIPFNSSFIPGSQEAWVNGAPDFNFDYDPLAGPNGAMEWSGTLDPSSLEVVTSSSPFGYLPLSAFFGPLPCSSVCDDTSISLSGFGSFDYLGQSYSTVVMGSNGIVVVGDDDTSAFDPFNQELPDPAAPNNVLAPFWTDIDMDGTAPDDDGAGIWYAGILSDGVNTFLIMEWEAVQEWNVPGPTYTFQVWIVLETSEIFYVYANFDDFPSFLTVGAEDSSGNIGSSYYFDGAGTMPVVGTDLEVLGELSTATFSFQVETGGEIGEPIVNVVEISSEGLEETAFASAITEVEEPDVELFIEGECPGIVNVYGFGATPGAYVRVFRGDWPGITAPPFRRRCRGTEVELDRASQLPPTVRADGKGGFNFTRRLFPFQCDGRIQAVDMGSCNVSTSVPLREVGFCGDCLFNNGTPGCENPECEAVVCGLDPFCCDTAWDDICAGEALTECVPDICVPDPD